ncbi:blue light receptor [Pleurotus ostreatus]|uniref:Blue light receptor n=2 Tax=Pleurotus TaxID=5320 RepID=A0A8H6ZPN4_PLEOS|nr:blue light receptor [Pleurotus ostreatus]KAF7426448.1 blue light receptor [Pleurotus ostreatus]KAG9222019.1 hypothetical protein CCMSSC00406_0010384 [Pleurotus cornucopiae]KAJ8693994.1 hypothetical protein PTI98_008927 [Pleurotus ostreatus]
MPFEKYLGPQDGQSHVDNSSSYVAPTSTSYTSSNVVHVDHAASSFSNPVQLQIPQFIYGGPPMLAPGGGAEVLPAASLNNSWFTNNGFTPRFPNEEIFHGHSQSISPDNEQRRSIVADPLAPTPRSARPPPFDYTPLHSLRTELPSTAPLLYSPLDMTAVSSKSLQPSTTQYPPSSNALSLAAPSSLGLPVYSSSGFDLLSILARVVNRPNPRISLGPVDLTCSFVVADVRRHDNPIIFCSPTFCALTGYDESEVVGRNCRFLQAPNGAVTKGEQRRFTSPEAVSYMRKSLAADKECQTSIVNYRKNGTAFINLVTVIPIPGGEQGLPHEEHEVYYHVGFQVDLNEQPNAILDKLRDGSYMVNYTAAGGGAPQLPYPTRERKGHTPPQPVMSKGLKALLADRTFIESLPPSSTTVAPPSSEKAESREASTSLSTVLLSNTPDFMLVVSLKGLFLYVAPAVRRVLGYEPEELVGKAITDYCYQHDIVPLTRELKESSATPGSTNDLPHSTMPRTVDLLFRARTKAGDYVWVECRGRLHVEPGKGRKAIILSGRAMGMASMIWSSIVQGGGLNTSIRNTRAISRPEDEGVEVEVVETEREFWGSLSKEGVLLVVGRGAKDVLGWAESEMQGMMLASYLANGEEHAMNVLDEELRRMYSEGRMDSRRVYTRMRRKDGGHASVHLVLHQPQPQSGHDLGIPRPSVLYQIQVIDHLPSNIQASGTLCHESSGDVFEELQVTRGTSWQYELQQLRFANQTLNDEIGLLEAQRVQAEQQQQQHQQSSRGEPYDGRASSSYNSYGGVKRSWDSRQ